MAATPDPPDSSDPADAPDPLSPPVSWRLFVTEAERRLRTAGDENAEIDARRIVEQASGYTGSAFFRGLDEPATERSVRHFDQMIERRLRGEPLQYVLGEWSFRTVELMVDRRVLIPRPETEIVVERALAELDRLARSRAARGGPGGFRVADLGTGSGAIALSVAVERADTEVWATDVSDDALAVARANLAGIGRPGARVHLASGSWFAALPEAHRGGFDLIISNPPYVAESDDLPDEVRDWEPTLALVSGPTGLESLDPLVDGAPAWLSADGVLVVELAPGQAAAVAGRARGLFTEVEIGRDLTGRDRMVIARRS